MSAQPQLDPTSVANHLCNILRTELLTVGDDFVTTSSLVENGLDSLVMTQLLLEIEQEYGVWLDESLLTPANLASCEALAACVCSAHAGGGTKE